MDGCWMLTIEWPEDDDEEPIVGIFSDVNDCAAVVDRYMKYNKVKIQFVAFDDPARF